MAHWVLAKGWSNVYHTCQVADHFPFARRLHAYHREASTLPAKSPQLVLSVRCFAAAALVGARSTISCRSSGKLYRPPPGADAVFGIRACPDRVVRRFAPMHSFRRPDPHASEPPAPDQVNTYPSLFYSAPFEACGTHLGKMRRPAMCPTPLFLAHVLGFLSRPGSPVAIGGSGNSAAT